MSDDTADSPETDCEDDRRAARARRYVLDHSVDTVETVLACADAVAETWDDEASNRPTAARPTTTDPKAVAGPLRGELEAAGAWERLPDVLAGAVRAAGCSLSAPPVADPPYVAATSRGPMLRAALPEGRLVVLVAAFAVERDPTRYVRAATTPAAAVTATFK